MRTRYVILLALAAWLCLTGAASALSLRTIGKNFGFPVFVTSDPRDADRLFIVDLEGRILRVEDGRRRKFLDIRSRTEAVGERGLFSMALAPNYRKSGRFYVFYTAEDDGDLKVDQYRAGRRRARPKSRRNVLSIPHPHLDHNGGQLQFGPDGYLYIGTGEGGGSGRSWANGQDTGSLLGKILRIDPRPRRPGRYAIPPGNPFVGQEGADEIWSYGLRNPYRFAFDRETGAIAIGDVGQSAWEEVDYGESAAAVRGANFGWSCREGRHPFPMTTDVSCIGGGPFTDPIFEYDHGRGECAIVGGYVARDRSLGDLYGRYLYTDVCRGRLRSIVPSTPTARGDRSEGVEVELPSSFGEDACGRLYLTSLTGRVWRLIGKGRRAGTCAGARGR